MYQWSEIGSDRVCIRLPPDVATFSSMWTHLRPTQRPAAIETEAKAYYDVIEYDSILDHTNISVDPSTGHMLQTLQMT